MVTLLEPHDAGKVLDLSAGRVRQLVDEGALVPVAVTCRGIRLFRLEDVEALRRARERARCEVGRDPGARNGRGDR